MTLGIHEFMLDFGKQLLANAAIQAYCQSRFSKALSVRVGQSVKDPASVSECPLVILLAVGRGTSDDGNLKTRQVRLGINIQAEDDTSTDASGIKYIPGNDDLDGLSDLIEKFICNYRETSGAGLVSTPSSGPEDLIDQDVFKAWLTFAVQLDSDYV